ncbi:MAG TPA: hypothetical protein VKU39_22360 [Streptosporangiaceae bacterium]|nr:hypothetical protein [Streptosporangiaceae bacterium]
MLSFAEYRYCLDCGDEQPFEQAHPLGCPDAPGDCPEWSCTACGATLMLAVQAA